MTPERWQQVKSVLAAALEADPSERCAYLDRVCAEDRLLREQVEDFLAVGQLADPEFLNGPGVTLARVEEPSMANHRIGLRIGAYQIIQEIGIGGMGEVYRAFRADDQYKKEVAIKLVSTGHDSAFVVSRFRNERQILATLEHPNIARLFDGGVTEEGIPYLVMELVEGGPIDDYCDTHKLPVIERLKLFLQVCSAVQYAHQHLVIHRDLKPSNILVTAEGVPKLLDFGIAKILNPNSTGMAFENTSTLFRLLTPGYASPEQVRGDPITTASDVYSLGVVLYELLTGRSPYGRWKGTAEEIGRAVCEIDPQKPSSVVARSIADNAGEPVTAEQISLVREGSPHKLRTRLRGDVDNIVLMALRKEPQRRYSSIEQFAADISRHLENLPVVARGDSARYRTGKFVVRHKAGATAVVVVLATLIAGLAITLRANFIARTERVRAERRFNDVRKLANSLIFEVHDSIETLPGATGARKIVLDRAREYLDSLAKEASGDRSLQRELAAAYERVGGLLGNTADANLGRQDEALITFEKALAIRNAVALANPGNVNDQLDLAVARHGMARLLANMGKSGAVDQDRQALAITEQLLKKAPSNFDVLRERGMEYEILGDLEEDPSARLQAYRNSMSFSPPLLKAHPEDRRLKRGMAIISVKIGNTLAELDSFPEALQYNRTGVELFKSLAQDQSDARVRRELAVALVFGGNMEEMNGSPSGALVAYRQSLDIVESMAKADPQNTMLQLDVAGDSSSLGRTLFAKGKYGEAEPALRRAIQLYEQNLARNPSDAETPPYLGGTYVWLGEIFAGKGNLPVALESYRKGVASFERLPADAITADTRGDIAIAQIRIAAVLAKMGDLNEAATTYQNVLATVEPLAGKNLPNLRAQYAAADAYFGMGQLSWMAVRSKRKPFIEQQKQWREARAWYRKSAAMWNRIPHHRSLSPGYLPCGSAADVARAIRQCDLALGDDARPPNGP